MHRGRTSDSPILPGRTSPTPPGRTSRTARAPRASLPASPLDARTPRARVRRGPRAPQPHPSPLRRAWRHWHDYGYDCYVGLRSMRVIGLFDRVFRFLFTPFIPPYDRRRFALRVYALTLTPFCSVLDGLRIG